MPNAIPAMGTVISYSTNGSTFTTIAGARSLSGPSPSADVIDVTTLNAPGGYREKIPGVFDAGEWQIEMNFIKTEYQALNTIFAAKNDFWLKAVTPSGASAATTLVASGFLTKCGDFDVAPDGAVTYGITMTQSGPPVVS